MLQSSIATAARPTPRLRGRQWGLLAGALLLLYGAGWAFGGVPGDLMLASVSVMPFTLLAVLTYRGEQRMGSRLLALFTLFVLAGGFALLGIAITYQALGEPRSSVDGLATQLRPGAEARLTAVVWGMVGASLAGALGFAPAVRRAFARFLPIDPTSFVHAIALVATTALTLMGVVPLLVLSEPPMLAAVRNNAPLDGGSSLFDLYSLAWTIPCAVFAVGYGQRRDLRAALERLGLVWPTRRQALLGVCIGALLVVLAEVVGMVVDVLWTRFDWPRTDGVIVERLLGSAVASPLGALVAALVAGVGEELSDRGVLQPRLGILLTSAIFTSMHAFQYHWDSLVWVFIASLILGLLRKRTNTTTTIIVHTVFDLLLFLAAVWRLPWLP